MTKTITKSSNFISSFIDLEQEWDYEKNTIDPQLVSMSSNNKFWWKCSYQHSWETTAKSRSDGNSCPYCKNRKVGYGNDLKTKKPIIAKEWDYIKNDIKPNEIVAVSSKRIHWKCAKGHEFINSPSNRKDTSKCPKCLKGSKKYIPVNESHPEILKYWSKKKNNKSIEEFSAKSNKNAWFKCDKGHVVSMKISDKVHFMDKCRKCLEDDLFKNVFTSSKNSSLHKGAVK
jgi:hypothetical protein